MKTSILFLIACSIISTAFGFGTAKYRATIHTNPATLKTAFDHLQFQLVDVISVRKELGELDVLLSDIEYDVLRETYHIEIIDSLGVTESRDLKYQDPKEIKEALEKFHKAYPKITKLVTLGKSLEGREIYAIKISDNPEKDEFEPRVLFNSMHHAREVMTPEVALDAIDYLTKRYKENAQVTKWVDNLEIWILPMFNVDGNNLVWTKDKWWRKNARGGYGVDLNRNYPLFWNKCNGSSGDRRSQTYRGDKPASEPETKVMMNFVAKIRPVFNISFHSYGELVIYPYGCDGDRTETKDIVEPIGKKMAELMDYRAGTGWELLYSVDGGDIDWMYKAYGVIPFVYEVSSSRQGFHPSYDRWRDKTVKKVRPGWRYLLEKALKSGVRGRINSKEEIKIDVYKESTSWGWINYMEALTTKRGDYHIILNPGKYKLVFKTESPIESEISIGSDLLLNDITILGK